VPIAADIPFSDQPNLALMTALPAGGEERVMYAAVPIKRGEALTWNYGIRARDCNSRLLL
jgi:hypothetical protein